MFKLEKGKTLAQKDVGGKQVVYSALFGFFKNEDVKMRAVALWFPHISPANTGVPNVSGLWPEELSSSHSISSSGLQHSYVGSLHWEPLSSPTAASLHNLRNRDHKTPT